MACVAELCVAIPCRFGIGPDGVNLKARGIALQFTHCGEKTGEIAEEAVEAAFQESLLSGIAHCSEKTRILQQILFIAILRDDVVQVLRAAKTEF